MSCGGGLRVTFFPHIIRLCWRQTVQQYNVSCSGVCVPETTYCMAESPLSQPSGPLTDKWRSSSSPNASSGPGDFNAEKLSDAVFSPDGRLLAVNLALSKDSMDQSNETPVYDSEDIGSSGI
ncbi:hypothetical protein WJX73_007520 [Symbiochloris irregularis]|uniref:Uncharacterized protein n=1 Tax=Symbiochloris irregularis TaxID=706552 RepID=A0AAW1NJR5_9CHLO